MPKLVIIDVREPDEFAVSHVEGSINIPLGEIASKSEKLKGIGVDSTITVYCNSGSRSAQAKHLLELYGYSDVQNGINQHAIESKK